MYHPIVFEENKRFENPDSGPVAVVVYTVMIVCRAVLPRLRELSAHLIGIPQPDQKDDQNLFIALRVVESLLSDCDWRGADLGSGFFSGVEGTYRFGDIQPTVRGLLPVINFLADMAEERWLRNLPNLDDVKNAYDRGIDISPEGCVWNTCLVAFDSWDVSNPNLTFEAWQEDVRRALGLK